MKKLVEGKKVIVALLAMILVTATVGMGVYDFGVKSGSLEIDGKVEEIKTNTETVGELLEEKGVSLEKEDKLNADIDEKLKDEFSISIKKAVPVVITADGSSKELKTAESTVAEVLKSKGIYYDKVDRVEPGLETEVTPHMEIELVRVTEAYKKVQEEIAYETETKENPELPKGQTKTVQAGEKGVKEKEVKEVYENGALASTETLSEAVSKEPVKEIVEKGTKEAVVASRSSSSRSGAVASGGNVSGSGMVFNASAYDDSPEQNGGYAGITAMGTRLRPGVVAVDPRVIPLGSRVYIEYMDGTPWGYGIAEDTGGAIKGNKIDIYMQSGTMEFGRRSMRVYIVN
ncbi:cell wall-binding protein YocH precursor [Andreesenia angusta]|uniref:Cell wall-binding protein YocH n=1 Tax=Andreesenia angusta TaxID=39480 RepID=A0A1S1V5R8_9FIRM|nr:3D domain-containing protein [Andreesenia angusta]OHW61447.1 cell wall-binding protein YocH precursor [Andreesenia angusta]